MSEPARRPLFATEPNATVKPELLTRLAGNEQLPAAWPAATRFVVIGHVDSGKSCLCGHLLYQCGHVGEHEARRVEAAAAADKMARWKWSRLLDTDPAEQARGKTHEHSVVAFRYGSTRYELVDTPGHGCFVPEMLAGASRDIDIAVLVLSVQEKEFRASFDRGLVKEHLILARASGIRTLVVAANKMDLVGWAQAAYADRTAAVVRYATKTLDWAQADIYCVPISAYHGIGLVGSGAYDAHAPWYTGRTLMETLAAIPARRGALSPGETKAETAERDRVGAKLTFADTGGSVVTAGFQCVAHFRGLPDAIEAEITRVAGSPPYVRSGERRRCTIVLAAPARLRPKQRVILRTGAQTVAFGRVCKAALAEN